MKEETNNFKQCITAIPAPCQKAFRVYYSEWYTTCMQIHMTTHMCICSTHVHIPQPCNLTQG